jgi:hypothetical protein
MQDTVIGMASSAPAATAGLTLAALAGRDALTLGLLPLGAAAFLGWVLVRSFAAAIRAQKWPLAAVLAVGVVLMLLARFVWRSPFFRLTREATGPHGSTPPGLSRARQGQEGRGYAGRHDVPYRWRGRRPRHGRV